MNCLDILTSLHRNTGKCMRTRKENLYIDILYLDKNNEWPVLSNMPRLMSLAQMDFLPRKGTNLRQYI